MSNKLKLLSLLGTEGVAFDHQGTGDRGRVSESAGSVCLGGEVRISTDLSRSGAGAPAKREREGGDDVQRGGAHYLSSEGDRRRYGMRR